MARAAQGAETLAPTAQHQLTDSPAPAPRPDPSTGSAATPPQTARRSWSALAVGAAVALAALLAGPSAARLPWPPALRALAAALLPGRRRRIRAIDWSAPARQQALRNAGDFRRLDRAGVALFGVLAAPAAAAAPGAPHASAGGGGADGEGAGGGAAGDARAWAAPARHGAEGVRALVRRLGPGNVFVLAEAASGAEEARALAWLRATGFYERTGLPPGPGHTLFLDPDALAAQARPRRARAAPRRGGL
jgi:hypothetical protein